MGSYFYILLFLLISTLAVSIWKVIIMKDMLKRPLHSNVELNDKKYFELKYQLQYVTTIFPIIITLLGFIGYNQLDTMDAKVTKEVMSHLQPKLNTIDSTLNVITTKQKKVEEDYIDIERVNKTLVEEQKGVSTDISNTKLSANQLVNVLAELQRRTEDIGRRDVIRRDIFIVDNLTISYLSDDNTYKYSTMKSLSGQPLPIFKKAPIVMALDNKGVQIVLCDITTTGFKAAKGLIMSPCDDSQDEKKGKFTIMIFSQDE